MARKLPPDAVEPMATLFGETLFEIMVGITQSETVEEEYAKIHASAKKLTKAEMKRRAYEAAKYLLEHANPSPADLSREQMATLKKQALEVALKTNGK